MTDTVLIGTAKGLIEVEFGMYPTITQVHFQGFPVTMVYADPRNGRWWVGISHKHWGQKLHFSDDKGSIWLEASVPSFGDRLMPNMNKAVLHQIWTMASGGEDQPNTLWLGTEPGALFVSRDGGTTFELVEGLWNDPSRIIETQWFATGSKHPFLHTIQIDPQDSSHLYVAISCAGVFESIDGGITWQPKNNGLKSAYLPEPDVDIGHDPHNLWLHPKNGNILWQQNHCGIFYSDDGARHWKEVSDDSGVPSYGFAMVIDVLDPAKAWVIPALNDEQRIPPGLSLSVFHTDNFGKSWSSISEGLPDKNCFDIVLRQSFARKGEKMVFGTNSGNVYYRLDNTTSWRCLTNNLTKVNVTVFV
ncbi:MAG: glycosyl hydrolase [Bacteroidota bacterium]